MFPIAEAASYSRWDNHHMPVPEWSCTHWGLCHFDRPDKERWHCPSPDSRVCVSRSDCHNKYGECWRESMHALEGSIAIFQGLLRHSGTVFLSIKLQMDQVKPLKSSVSALHDEYCLLWTCLNGKTVYFAQLSALVTPLCSRKALSCSS